MPEIEFTIDTETGAMEMKIEGVAGASCADVAKLAEELLGTPARDERTREFYLRPEIQARITGRK